MLLLIIFIVVLVIVCYYWINYHRATDVRVGATANTIQSLYKDINAICYRANISLNYRIEDNKAMTFTESGEDAYIIHLIIWNDKYKRPHDYNFLIHDILKEVATIINTRDNVDVTEKLFTIAQQLGYYDAEMILKSR